MLDRLASRSATIHVGEPHLLGLARPVMYLAKGGSVMPEGERSSALWLENCPVCKYDP
jgi:hypothetical protein